MKKGASSKFIAGFLAVMLVTACASRQEARVASQPECPSALSNEQELTLSMIGQREKDGQLYAALAALQTLPESSPSVLRYKGDVLRRLGRSDAAGHFQRLQKTCLGPWGDHGLGLVAADEGDMKSALELLGRAAEKQPMEYRFRNDLGVAMLRMHKIEEARFELMTALELSPERNLPAVNLLSLLMAQEKPAAARSLAQRYRLGEADWQAAAQSCEDLMDRWSRQGIDVGGGACSVPLLPPVAVQGH